MTQLDLSLLPDLPQTPFLKQLLDELWTDPQVLCVWLTGSLARGEGDQFSDVDLGVALQPDAFHPEQLPRCVAQLSRRAIHHAAAAMGEHATLHFVLLDDGTLYDLMVQSTDHPMREQQRLVLASRDDAFAARLEVGGDPSIRVSPAEPSTIRDALITFWLAQLRHHKVLARDLGLVAWTGEQLMRPELIRLWYVQATGNDCGPLRQMTIHTLSPVVRAVRAAQGERALTLIGRPLRTRREIIDATTELRDEVARVGRRLADLLQFDYPVEIEATVLRRWQAFPL